jgi:hypothetical protein
MAQDITAQIQAEVAKQLKSRQFNTGPTNLHKHSGTGTDGAQIPFLNLSDTPKSYYQSPPTSPATSLAGANVVVNSTATGLTFSTTSSKTYYMGTVTSGAAGSPFPSGWTVSNGSTGEYTITHNLGTTAYTVATLAHSSYFCELASKGSNSFLLIFWASQSTTDNTDFDFQLFT